MTESKWLQCDDPRALHELVGERITWRKKALWLLACSQDIWGESGDEIARSGLAHLEHLAETGHPGGIRMTLQVDAGQAVIDCDATWPDITRVTLKPRHGRGALEGVDLQRHNPVLCWVLEELACVNREVWSCKFVVAYLAQAGLSLPRQAELYRDIVRGPFRPLHFRAAWRTWHGGIPRQIAEEIYQERAFNHLPILADALEEADCQESEVLDHLRGPGPHARGCWAVDLVRGII